MRLSEAHVDEGGTHVKGASVASNDTSVVVLDHKSALFVDLVADQNLSLSDKDNLIELIKLAHDHFLCLHLARLKIRQHLHHKLSIRLILPGVELGCRSLKVTNAGLILSKPEEVLELTNKLREKETIEELLLHLVR